MIIDNGTVKYKDTKIKYYEEKDFQVYFQGIIYISHIKSGIESIKKILSEIKNNKINNISKIKGNYFIFIIDKTTDYKYVFVDNSGIFKAFIYENVISTSLLEMIKYLNFDSSKLNFKTIVQFLHFGFTYFNQTFFKNTRKIDKNKIIVYNQNNKQIIEDKEIGKINQSIDLDILGFFDGFYEAVKDKRMSIDLTGGSDSRLVVSLLEYLNADFELSVSGIIGTKDIDIAKNISNILKKDFFVTYHNIENITNDFLKDLFYITDGQIDILSYHRKHQLTLHKKERGIDIQITGAGGELYKDFWWLQDFPLYRKKSANIKKLYDLRIEPVIYPHDHLGNKTKAISLNLRDNTIEKLYKYKLGTNTQTYDNIYYNYKNQAHTGAYVTSGNKLIGTYAPLLESDLVRLGFALKRKSRFYNNFHREIISTYCPMISKIRTTEGVTCSSRMSDKLNDCVRYVFDKQKRLTKQILRKLLKRTYLQASPTDRRIYKKVARLDIFKNQIPILKDHEIIDKDLKIENIRNDDIGRFLVIGIFLRELDRI